MLKAIANFFLVNRSLLHSDRWLREPFTRGQAWVDLFGLAQHCAGYMQIRGVRVDLKRGQLGYSQLTLAKRWKWSRDKVRRHLRRLETAGDIIQQTTQVTTVITIVDYNTWQGIGDESIQQTIQHNKRYNRTAENDTTNGKNCPENDTTKQTTQIKANHIGQQELWNAPLKSDAIEQATNDTTEPQKRYNRTAENETHTNKNINNKKNKYNPNSDEFVLSKLLIKCILERKPDFKKPNIHHWAKHIDRMIRLDNRAPPRIREVIVWCQTDDFWQNNILSTEKLRKQFDKLELKMAGHNEQGAKNKRDYGNQQSSIGTTIEV